MLMVNGGIELKDWFAEKSIWWSQIEYSNLNNENFSSDQHSIFSGGLELRNVGMDQSGLFLAQLQNDWVLYDVYVLADSGIILSGIRGSTAYQTAHAILQNKIA